MSRHSGEPLARIQLKDGEPWRFTWRYTEFEVRQVLAHWVEVGPWWRVGAGVEAEQARDACESTFWRVEAVRAKTVRAQTVRAQTVRTAGVYDLRVVADRWSLARVID